MKNTATHDPGHKTKFNVSHRKEGKCWFTAYLVVDLDAEPYGGSHMAHAPVELRIYSTESSSSACLWVRTKKLCTSGSGKANGGGYSRQSAAAAYAISNAGFALQKHIDGVGMDAVEDALRAIAECLGIARFCIISTYQ